MNDDAWHERLRALDGRHAELVRELDALNARVEVALVGCGVKIEDEAAPARGGAVWKGLAIVGE